MNTSTIVLNSLQIDIKKTRVTIGIYTTEQRCMKSRQVQHLPEDLQKQLKLESDEYVWLSSLCDENTISYTLDLEESPSLAAWYYSDRAYRELGKQSNLQQLNFTHDWIYWYRNEERFDDPCVCFEKFSLQFRAYHNDNNKLCLQCNVVDEGESYILNRSLMKIVETEGFDTQLLGKVVYNKHLIPFEKLTSDQRNDSANIYPLINYRLADFLNIEIEHPTHTQKMEHFFQRINAIKTNYLNTEDFKDLVPHNNEWMPANTSDLIKNTSPTYCFGNQAKTTNINFGLKEHGPIQHPDNKHTHLFFIYPKQCQSLKEEIEKHLSPTTGYTQLNTYSHLNASYKKELNLIITSPDKAISEINEHLDKLPLLENGNYFVFYISPYSKYDPEREHKTLYFDVKEALLRKDIRSQVFDYTKGNNQKLNYWMPNIASAMITKLGGVSWLLDKSDIKELVIGFGASRSLNDDEQYIGSAFCFDNKGKFKDFKCWEKSKEWALIGQLKTAIKDFYTLNKEINRIIIHYFKPLSRKDFDYIENMLDDLNFNIPVVVVKINNSFCPSTLAFNTAHTHKLLLNGSYIKLHHHNYLLYINDYKTTKGTPTKGLFPLKLELQSNRVNYVSSKNVVNDIMQQLHDFTHLHWRSLAQPRIPVTIAYPQYLAKLSPNFQSQLMINNTIRGLWFL